MAENKDNELEALRKEVDSLKADIEELKRFLIPSYQEQSDAPDMVGHVEKMHNLHSDPSLMTIMDRLENKCGESGSSGCISYVGVFASGGRQSSWIKDYMNTDDLLSLIDNGTAVTALSCIGSQDRMKLLMALLKQPMTAAQLVKACGFNTTGQVYHHLNVLVAADLVYSERELYIVQPYRVQGIIMLLAGISDLTDNEYGKGDWAD